MLYRIPVLLVSFTVHELAHALTAYRFGDDTAKAAGRLSLNPVRHIDPFGAIMLVFSGFGWAKPVPINPENFRSKKAGIIFTSLAGPLSNVLMAIIFGTAYVLSNAYARQPRFLPISTPSQVTLTLLYYFVNINIALAAFNLLPIPPLDGSKILLAILPDRIYYGFILRYERYGMFILIGLSVSGYLMDILIPVIGFLWDLVNFVVKPVTSLFI